MFDVGFWELVLIFGMGLLILGPERMPRVASQIGRWVGRARRTASSLRRQLEQEIAAEVAFASVADVGREHSNLLNAQLGWVAGFPLVRTPVVELADANGAYEATHASGTVGQIVFVHRGVVKVGLFQPLRFMSEYVAHARTFVLHATVELDVQQLEVGGVAVLYNNTV